MLPVAVARYCELRVVIFFVNSEWFQFPDFLRLNYMLVQYPQFEIRWMGFASINVCFNNDW